MSENSLVLTDELFNEFLEETSGYLPDPEQYPLSFRFILSTFLWTKGLITDE
jgi:hypothetical protein